MRAIVFAYHNMGIIGIRSLLAHGFDIPMVFSHADDPRENRWFGSVTDLCHGLGIAVHLPEDVNSPPWPSLCREARPDFLFSFYYRSLLGREVLSSARLCAFNLHGSLLPRYRGRAPVNWVLVKGETETGVTLHVMDERADAGDIVGQLRVPIAFEDTALTLYGKMEVAAGQLLNETLPRIVTGEIPRRPNEVSQGSYFGGRKPEDGRIDWKRPALEIYNLIRAVSRPYPGAFSFLKGEKCLIWWARPFSMGGFPSSAGPGTIATVDRGTLPELQEPRAIVCAGEGSLALEEIEWAGRTAKGDEIFSIFKGMTGWRFE
jgi:UDP-4-amino-4-deoxy-L-arabinose formyltransferase / UDP-glucuronic acid dehydrogenase (UDP-4-keto-hexauronic acid decarboxylating)